MFRYVAERPLVLHPGFLLWQQLSCYTKDSMSFMESSGAYAASCCLLPLVSASLGFNTSMCVLCGSVPLSLAKRTSYMPQAVDQCSAASPSSGSPAATDQPRLVCMAPSHPGRSQANFGCVLPLTFNSLSRRWFAHFWAH